MLTGVPIPIVSNPYQEFSNKQLFKSTIPKAYLEMRICMQMTVKEFLHKQVRKQKKQDMDMYEANLGHNLKQRSLEGCFNSTCRGTPEARELASHVPSSISHECSDPEGESLAISVKSLTFIS
jgi:hypothetical protein